MSKSNKLVKISDLWNLSGQISRLSYVGWGVSLVALKYALDIFISSYFFHRTWSFINYLALGQVIDVLTLSQQDQIFYGSMLVISLPFIWVGIVLTMSRLRSIGMPIWLCKLFFLPVVNLAFFVVLSILPEQSNKALFELESQAEPHEIEILSPEQKKTELVLAKKDWWKDATYSIVLTVPVGAFLAFLGSTVLKTYGWGLFIGIPFAVGMASAYFFGRKHLRGLLECIVVSYLATSLLGFVMFFWAWEGIFCILMASPLAYTLAVMGALLGYHLQKMKNIAKHTLASVLSLLLVLPIFMAAEYKEPGVYPLCAVHSTCEVSAPPGVVWKNVIAFPSLPEPKEWFFKLGIAYPIGAEISGIGVGAVRRCKFSTGTFVEPITIWKEPQLLQFSVAAQPESMRELSWNHELKPAHLNNYLNIKKGEFRLAPIYQKNGVVHTRIMGTTWYRNQMWPASYWSFFVDNIIHAIHLRVLNQIRFLSEQRLQ